jgi:hypothetical protein
MTAHIDVAGGSGVLYRFNLAENARPVTAVAGLYLYVRQKPGKPPELLYIGVANSLQTDAVETWRQGVDEHGATHLFIRLDVSRATREAARADLMAAYNPPMNA